MQHASFDNVFNPSLQCVGSVSVLAFRHFGVDQQKPFAASAIIADDDGVEVVSLTAHAAAHGAPTVADPKLFRLGDEVWATFNDGWSPTQNRVFVMQVHPELGPPREVHWAERRAIEKNWGFFADGDQLRVLYSLSPLVVLQAPLEELRVGSGRLVVDKRPGPTPKTWAARGYTLGTQPVQHNGALWVVAHERHHLLRWRAYVGRLVRLRLDDDNAPLKVLPGRMVHSRRSMLGAFPKHNAHLLSCSYFSGLLVDDDAMVLGYGVNDLSAHFAQLPVPD